MKLADFAKEFKRQDRAQEDVSAYLSKTIDDYMADPDRLDDYVADHLDKVKLYFTKPDGITRQPYRASAAGKCLQQQAFKARDWPETNVVNRKSAQQRALSAGTFIGVRWHMVFDALHDLGLVETIAAEVRFANPALQLSGSPDRIIRVPILDREPIILDFKTIKARYWEQLLGPQQAYIDQVHAYKLLMTGLSEYTQPTRYCILYENKNTHELKIYDRPFESATLEHLRENYTALENWDGKDDSLSLNTDWCMFCPWQKACKEIHGRKD
jgi:hypothetical protein